MLESARFEFVTVELLRNQVFWNVMLCHSGEETLTLWRNIVHSS